jgi:hypothetical protein
MKSNIDMIITKERMISPKFFLSLSDKEKRNIESCEFVPPVIGQNNFGKFVINIKNPVYTIYHDKTQ